MYLLQHWFCSFNSEEAEAISILYEDIISRLICQKNTIIFCGSAQDTPNQFGRIPIPLRRHLRKMNISLCPSRKSNLWSCLPDDFRRLRSAKQLAGSQNVLGGCFRFLKENLVLSNLKIRMHVARNDWFVERCYNGSRILS